MAVLWLSLCKDDGLNAEKPMFYDGHMHTPLCKHAVGEPEEYALVGRERGLTGVIFTCHNPLADGVSPTIRMEMGQFEAYVRMVERAAGAMRGKVDVRLGLECDYWPGLEGFLKEQLKWAEFHHVLGSVHCHMGEYQEIFWGADVMANQRLYFEHLAIAAESGLFDTLAHPDLIKNSFTRDWKLEPLLEHVFKCLDRIAATGVAMELNTSGLLKRVPEFNPGMTMLKAMRERGIPVVIGSDSHVPSRVGDKFVEALKAMKEAGYTHASYFLGRKRREILIEDAMRMVGAGGR
jgi:histidinol-phosphatase (PHP family)